MSLELLIRRVADRLGLQIQRTPVSLWDNDPAFTALMEALSGKTLVDPVRCRLLYLCAQQASRLSGEAAEVGVYRGGTARLLCEALKGTGKAVHLFDTFSGMPQTDPARDLHQAGDFSDTSFEAVKSFLAGFPAAAFHPGLFPATAQGLPQTRFGVVHVDVDIHASVRECCRFFYPRMTAGGMIVFDDYGQPGCPGARAAVDEFFADKPERPLPLPTGQCIVFKLP